MKLTGLSKSLLMAGGLALAAFGLHKIDESSQPSYVREWGSAPREFYAQITTNLNENFGSPFSDSINNLELLVDAVHKKNAKLDYSTQKEIEKAISRIESLYNFEIPSKIQIRSDQLSGKQPREFSVEETSRRLNANFELQDGLPKYISLLLAQLEKDTGVQYTPKFQKPSVKLR